MRARAQVMQQNPRETLSTRACDGVPASSGAADAWRWSLGARLRETRLKIVPESRTLPERIPTDQHEERVRNRRESASAHEWICLVDLSVLEEYLSLKGLRLFALV